jgi:hypothetical protein
MKRPKTKTVKRTIGIFLILTIIVIGWKILFPLFMLIGLFGAAVLFIAIAKVQSFGIHFYLMFVSFILITSFCHFTQDYITSRINKYFLAKKDTHNFFVCIGFDQILHYVQLYYTLKLLGLI